MSHFDSLLTFGEASTQKQNNVAYEVMNTSAFLQIIVRRLADTTSSKVSTLPLLQRFRRRFGNLLNQRISIPSTVFTHAMVKMADVSSASIHVDLSGIHCDVIFQTGEHIQATIIPLHVRFAPHGSKEMTWLVKPAEQATNHRCLDVISTLSGVITHTLWPVHFDEHSAYGGIVDRQDADHFTIDLRTTPTGQALRRNTALESIMELIQLKNIDLSTDIVFLRFALPSLSS